MSAASELGAGLAASLEIEVREALVDDPEQVLLDDFGLRIEFVAHIDGGGCSLDGRYDRDAKKVEVAERASGRRMHFTLLHELGHHLLQNDMACVRHLVAADRRSRVEEEAIADAFAAEVLVPVAVAESVLGRETPRARDVLELFHQRRASRSACAVRAAERCPGNGYVVIAAGNSIIHAAPFGSQVLYPVRRGTEQPIGSPLELAGQRSAYRGEGPIHFPAGAASQSWFVDAVRDDDGYTFAIMSDDRGLAGHWTPPGSGGDRVEAPLVDCPECDREEESWTRCARCQSYSCHVCGWCPSCSAKRRRPKERRCPGCTIIRPESSFPEGSELCSDECI